MHNSNFIDAENAWKQADEFLKFAISIAAVMAKDRAEFVAKTPAASRLRMMAECLERTIKGLQFDIETGKMCHFKVA